MCSDCGSNPPLTLTCKSDEHARAFVVVLNADGGTLVNSRGEDVPATCAGAVVTVPWNGNPMVLAQFGSMAVGLGFAEMDAVKDMTDEVNSAASGIPVVVLRAMRKGASFEHAARAYLDGPGEDKVDELISGLTRLVHGETTDLPEFQRGDLFG